MVTGEGVRAYFVLKLTFLMIDFALVLWPPTKGSGWNLKLFDRNWKRSCDHHVKSWTNQHVWSYNSSISLVPRVP